MKKLLALTTLLFVLLVSTSFAAPQAPQLCYSATGLNITLDWTSVRGATGYTLYYAPFPYKGEHTIGSINMGTSTDIAYYLWENAHYYIAVTARDASGESVYSNIELFSLNSNSTSASIQTCDDIIDISGNGDLSIIQ